MPSIRQVERATRKYRPRFTCKNICLTILAILVLVIPPFLLLIIRPYHYALTYEVAYFEEIQRLDTLDEQWRWVPDYLPDSPRKPPAYNNRTLPLIHDIPQLTSWDFEEQMELNKDGTAKQPDRETWIYVGGTPTNYNWLDKISAFHKPNGSCVDSEDICRAYNEGFNTLIEKYHVDRGIDHGGKRTSNAYLAFMDCDVSPLLCDFSNQRPVVLLHMKTMQPCKMEYDTELRWTCSVRTTSVGLPLDRMPFTKTQTIAGHVVPVFPSAYEQLHAMVSWDGSLEGLGEEYIAVVEKIVDV